MTDFLTYKEACEISNSLGLPEPIEEASPWIWMSEVMKKIIEKINKLEEIK